MQLLSYFFIEPILLPRLFFLKDKLGKRNTIYKISMTEVFCCTKKSLNKPKFILRKKV